MLCPVREVVDGEVAALAVVAFLGGAGGQMALFRTVEDAQLAVVHPFVILCREEGNEAVDHRREVHLCVAFSNVWPPRAPR